MCDTVRLAGSLGGKDLTTAWMRTDEGGGSNLMATLQVKGHLVTGWGNKVTSWRADALEETYVMILSGVHLKFTVQTKGWGTFGTTPEG